MAIHFEASGTRVLDALDFVVDRRPPTSRLRSANGNFQANSVALLAREKGGKTEGRRRDREDLASGGRSAREASRWYSEAVLFCMQRLRGSGGRRDDGSGTTSEGGTGRGREGRSGFPTPRGEKREKEGTEKKEGREKEGEPG